MQASTHIPPDCCLGSHQALRAATAASHARLDALFAGFDLGDRDDHRGFLLAHAEAALWGAAYVLEGSRLGGAALARRLAAEYLAAASPGAWPQFLRQMDAPSAVSPAPFAP